MQGKQYTNIESSVDFNDLCVIPNTGLTMMAVEDQKMQIHYVPSLGMFHILNERYEKKKTHYTIVIIHCSILYCTILK